MAARKKKSTPAKPGQPAHGLPPATVKDVRVRVFKGHTGTVMRVAMPEDGRFVLTSSADGTVRRWALAEAGTKGDIVCKGKAFYGLAVTADGSRAAAGMRMESSASSRFPRRGCYASGEGTTAKWAMWPFMPVAANC